MLIERTFKLDTKSDKVTMDVNFTVKWEDTSFDHAFGTQTQGHWEVDSWELQICKLALGWKCITLDCLEVPEPFYDVLNTLVEKHLENNPIPKDNE